MSRITPSVVEQCIEMYIAKQPLSTIREELGLHDQQIYKILAQDNISLRGQNERRTQNPNIDAAVNEYIANISTIESIQAKFGVTLQSLYRELNRKGLSTRRKHHRVIDAVLKKRIEDLLNEGRKVRDIALECNVSLVVIYRIQHQLENK